MATATISILGCGWLGLPLAISLAKKGYHIKGSTTTESKLSLLKDAGIDPFLLRLSPSLESKNCAEFLNAEILIVNIPPGTKTKSPTFHIEQIDNLIPHIAASPIKKIIYISSTSVYPNLNRAVKEEDCTSFANAGNVTLAVAENRLQLLPNKEVTIIRMGGLTGYNRLLIRHFAGKKDLAFGEEPVNLIHRDDAIGVIEQIISQKKWGFTFNACSPMHPLKKDFYTYLAEQHGFEKPTFITSDNQPFKLINTDKLMQELAYTFLFPDPMKYSYE